MNYDSNKSVFNYTKNYAVRYMTRRVVIGILLIAGAYFSKSGNMSVLYNVLICGIVCFCLYLEWKFFDKYVNDNKVSKSDIRAIDNMSGIDFENYLKVMFEKKGYRFRTTKKSNDYGVDLVLIKDDTKTAVQVKRYKSSIGVSAIQQVLGGSKYYNCSKCMVITNSFYTASAKKLAQRCNVQLWDRNNITKLCGSITEKRVSH